MDVDPRSHPVPGPPRARSWVELGAMVFLLGAALMVLRPFLVPMAWAIILAFATWPVFRRVERALGNRTGWAAVAMTVLMVLVAVGPALMVSLALAREIQQVFDGSRAWVTAGSRILRAWAGQIPWIGSGLAGWLDDLAADPAAMRQWVLTQVRPWLGSIAGALGNLGRNLAEAGVALITLYVLYRHGGVLLPQVRRVSRRLAGEWVYAMLTPVGATVRAVVYGMLLTALAQGALAMLGYWAAALGSPVLLGVTTVLLAFIPFGAPMVYVPASLWLFMQERVLVGGLLLAWGILVVSSADNVIRSWLISGATRVPFLLVFFGVLGGLAAFGLIGLFVGPIAMTLVLVLWREWTEGSAQELEARDS